MCQRQAGLVGRGKEATRGASKQAQGHMKLDNTRL